MYEKTKSIFLTMQRYVIFHIHENPFNESPDFFSKAVIVSCYFCFK